MCRDRNRFDKAVQGRLFRADKGGVCTPGGGVPSMEAAMAQFDSAFQDELEDLDRKNWSLWLLNGLLLVTMAAVITSLYLPRVWGLIVPEIPAPETRGMLVTGMCGLVLIFMFYMLLKQRQMLELRNDLIRA